MEPPRTGFFFFAGRLILIEILEVRDSRRPCEGFALQTGFLCHQLQLRKFSPYLQAIKILYPLRDIVTPYGKVY